MRNLVLTAVVVVTGCGEAAIEDSVAVEPVERAPSIIGDLDWIDTSKLAADSAERRAANAVAYLSLPSGSRCTGFLVADDLLLTNYHCVPGSDAARGVVAGFNYEALRPTEDWDIQPCNEWLGGDEGLDWALLRCPGLPGRVHGALRFADTLAASGDGAYLVHHNCDYYAFPVCDPSKKLSRGVVQVRVGAHLLHTADSLGGSSGGPLLDAETHAIVGVHRAHSGFDAQGRGGINWAIPADLLQRTLSERWPEWFATAPEHVEEAPPAVGRRQEREPNDTWPAADRLAATELVEGKVATADDDWFELTHEGGALHVELAFEHAVGDLDLSIYDEWLEVVSGSYGVLDREAVDASLAAGRYFVRVYGYSGAMGAYVLSR
jgi:hypothetical protein